MQNNSMNNAGLNYGSKKAIASGNYASFQAIVNPSFKEPLTTGLKKRRMNTMTTNSANV